VGRDIYHEKDVQDNDVIGMTRIGNFEGGIEMLSKEIYVHWIEMRSKEMYFHVMENLMK